MLDDFPNGYPQNPNQPGVEDRTTWNFKASGSYDAPWGIRLSPVLRHQSGVELRAHADDPGVRRHRRSAPSGTALSPSHRTPTAKTTSRCSTSAPRRVLVRPPRPVCGVSRSRSTSTNSHASETIAPRDGLQYLKPAGDPGAAHGARRLPLHLLRPTGVGSCGGVVSAGGRLRRRLPGHFFVSARFRSRQVRSLVTDPA